MAGNKLSALSLSGKTIFLVIIFCFLAVLFIRIRLINVYTQNIGGMEQNVIFSIQTLASGTPLYTDPEKPLYAFTQYSPIYFHIVAYTGKLAGFDPAEPIQWYRLSRLYSLLFNLLLLFVVYRMLKIIAPEYKLIAIGLSLMLFVFFEQQDYSRPDSLYHLFFGLSFYYYYRIIINGAQVKYMILTGIIIALALYSKQSAVFLLSLISFLFLFSSEQRRKIHWFLLSFLISIIILYFIFLTAPKEILIKNLYLSLMNGFDIRWAIRLYFLTALPRFILFFLIITVLILLRNEMKNTISRNTTISAIFYLTIAVFSGMKWGSGTNYFFEFCLLLIPGTLFLYKHLQSKNYEQEMIHRISLALLVTMLIPQLMIIGWRDYYISDRNSYLRAKETVQLIEKQSWYSSSSRFIIPERKWLSNFLYNKTLYAQPDIYRTLWNTDSRTAKIHPSAPPDAKNIFLIRSKTNPYDNLFNINLTGYTSVLKYDAYEVFASSGQ